MQDAREALYSSKPSEPIYHHVVKQEHVLSSPPEFDTDDEAEGENKGDPSAGLDTLGDDEKEVFGVLKAFYEKVGVEKSEEGLVKLAQQGVLKGVEKLYSALQKKFNVDPRSAGTSGESEGSGEKAEEDISEEENPYGSLFIEKGAENT